MSLLCLGQSESLRLVVRVSAEVEGRWQDEGGRGPGGFLLLEGGTLSNEVRPLCGLRGRSGAVRGRVPVRPRRPHVRWIKALRFCLWSDQAHCHRDGMAAPPMLMCTSDNAALPAWSGRTVPQTFKAPTSCVRVITARRQGRCPGLGVNKDGPVSQAYNCPNAFT